MATPENPEDYVRYETEGDLLVYVSRDLLERQKPGTRRLRFYIGGYGGYWLSLPEPWEGGARSSGAAEPESAQREE